MEIIFVVLLLAILVESMTEYFAPKSLGPYLKYLAALLGVGAAFAYQVDLVAVLIRVFGGQDAGVLPAAVGYVITGLIIGRGSNYVNDIIGRVRGENGSGSSVSVDTAGTVNVNPTTPAPDAPPVFGDPGILEPLSK